MPPFGVVYEIESLLFCVSICVTLISALNKINQLAASVKLLCNFNFLINQRLKSEFLLPLNRCRWLSTNVVHHPIDTTDFIDDAIGYFTQ